MNLWQALLLGLVQGLTEFIPVSSSGHLELVEYLFNFQADNFHIFLECINLGTLLALLIYFRRRIWKILCDIFRERNYRLAINLVITTIPAGLAGLLLGDLISENPFFSSIITVCAAMGIVTQIFVMTGLAMNIVFFIKTLSGNVGIVALVLTMAVTILFGMGVPTTAAYVLVASLAGSVLIELGFNSIAVHLFIYYYAALANITPPVASAALVASKIAKSDYFKTAATATRLGLPGFILPFMFTYNQELLLMGNPLSIVMLVFSCGLGLFCMCACFEGYIFRPLKWWERILMGVCAVCGIDPGLLTDIICYVIFILVVGGQYLQVRRAKAKQA